ncbi:MAG: hypothetical protein H6718_03265 [Polyangiaceae bacterium]|nr:hypothetical protein [Myxococcales bacterium]MCB9584386.1 hypothetical protein [Polyangiaceae bacterium]
MVGVVEHTPSMPIPLTRSQLFTLAGRAKVDPRTVRAVASGRRVRGDAGLRARLALIAAGYPIPSVAIPPEPQA